MDYSKHFNTKATAQTKPIPVKKQIKNNAGGFVFAAGNWTALTRFLILGSEGGTYYAEEAELTEENAKNVIECIKEDGIRVVNSIVDTSVNAKAPKNDPAIFALALSTAFGDATTKQAAYAAITKVCRTGTHIFMFCEAVKKLRGWSRGLRRGVANFYIDRNASSLAHQLIKYRQRNGWTHKDVIKLSHPKASTLTQSELFKYAIGKTDEVNNDIIIAFDTVQRIQGTSRKEVKLASEIIEKYNLPREALPTHLLNSEEIWEALLQKMPLTAMVRNLGKMTSIGLLDSDLSENAHKVVSKITSTAVIKESKIHPMSLLLALKTYATGHGNKGSLSWNPVQSICDALDEAFYMAFDNVMATKKKHLVAIDVSGSMGSLMMNSPLTYCEAAAALAMTLIRSEPWVEVVGFSQELKRLPITSKMRLDQVTKIARDNNFGSTDCSLPMQYAHKNKLSVDVFSVITDNETYYGNTHPSQALEAYRNYHNKDAKLAVFGMAANKFSIADPNDPGMMDFCGFSTDIPTLFTLFCRGEI